MDDTEIKQRQMLILAQAKARAAEAAKPKEPPGLWGTLGDAAMSLGTGVAEAIPEIAMAPASIKRFAEDKIKEGLNWAFPIPKVDQEKGDQSIAARADAAMYAGQDKLRKMENGILHQPETEAGKYARTIGNFVPAIVAPELLAGDVGGAMRAATTIAAPGGIASQFAGDLKGIKGTKYEPWVRFGAGILGTLPGAFLQSGRSGRYLGRAVSDVTDDEFRAAEGLANRANVAGQPLMKSEAIQAVTGGRTNIGDAARVIEGTSRGGNVITPFVNARPAQQQELANRAFDTISPRTATPAYAGAQLQEAAGDALNRIKGQINSMATPYYDALKQVHLPQGDYAALASNPTYVKALGVLRGNDELNRAYAALPDNNLAVVNEVVKQMDTLANNAVPNPANPYSNATLAGIRGGSRADANTVAGGYSADWRTARGIESAGRDQVLGPLQAGPLGDIAATNNPISQSSALFNAKHEAEAAAAARLLSQQNPDATNRVVRAGLENKFTAAQRGDPSVPLNRAPGAELAGAAFAKKLRDNPQVARSVLAAVENTAGPQAAQELSNALDLMGVTGWRVPVGSRTAFNAGALADDLSSSLLTSAPKLALNPFTGLRDTLTRANLGRNTQNLAEILVGQGDWGTMRRLSRAANNAPVKDALVAALARVGPTVDAAEVAQRAKVK